MRSQVINEELWEIVYELHFGEIREPVDDLLREIKQLEAVTNVSLLAPQLALPV
jgi:hypothetical protein